MLETMFKDLRVHLGQINGIGSTSGIGCQQSVAQGGSDESWAILQRWIWDTTDAMVAPFQPSRQTLELDIGENALLSNLWLCLVVQAVAEPQYAGIFFTITGIRQCPVWKSSGVWSGT